MQSVIVWRLTFFGQVGPFNPDRSALEEGFLCGLSYRAIEGCDRNLEVWTLQPSRPQMALVDGMLVALDECIRVAILAIKRELRACPGRREACVQSRHVYRAALDGVRSFDAFTEYIREHGFNLPVGPPP